MHRIRRGVVGLIVLSLGWTLSMASAQESSPSDLPGVLDDLDFVNQPGPAATQPAQPSVERTDVPARSSRRPSRSEFASLNRVPNMFGDSLGINAQVAVPRIDQTGSQSFNVYDLPLGVGRNLKAGENNKPLPMDRVSFQYNGFQNALQQQSFIPEILPPLNQSGNVDMYTFGFEKTFRAGQDSIEVRLPMLGVQNPTIPGGAHVDSGSFGDVTLFWKHLLYRDDMTAISAGVGVSLPTAQDIRVQGPGLPLVIHTDAVHVTPYLGIMTAPNDRWFTMSFLQFDFAASGNPIDGVDPVVPASVYTEQSLMMVDFMLGRWLYQDPSAMRLQGVAAIFEVHYATTLQDGDRIRSTLPVIGVPTIGNLANRVDTFNLTGGVHVQIGPLANLRVGCVLPVQDTIPNRQFDSEINVSFNRFF